jgi:hypothetical protein
MRKVASSVSTPESRRIFFVSLMTTHHRDIVQRFVGGRWVVIKDDAWDSHEPIQWTTWDRFDNSSFRNDFEMLWLKYDRDLSHTLQGRDTAEFLSDLTDLVHHNYTKIGDPQDWSRLRAQLQRDLDANWDGKITRVEAEDFIRRRDLKF